MVGCSLGARPTTARAPGEEPPTTKPSQEPTDPSLPADVTALRRGGHVLEARQALLRHRRHELDPARQRAQDEELRDLRNWLEPAQTPNLFSMTGAGAALFGRYQPQRDGTYVATLCLTVLTLPVFPTSAWLAREDAEGQVVVLGRVPLPPGPRIVRTCIKAGAVVWMLWSATRFLAGHL